MSDVVYKFESVPKHSGAAAERMAVLRTFMGPGAIRDDQVLVSAKHVLGLWRHRCQQLREAGYLKFQSVKFQYARNCPPAGVVAKPLGSRAKMLRCQCGTICPWCWARMTVKRTFDEITETLERLGEAYDRAAPESARYKLIATNLWDRRADSADQP